MLTLSAEDLRLIKLSLVDSIGMHSSVRFATSEAHARQRMAVQIEKLQALLIRVEAERLSK